MNGFQQQKSKGKQAEQIVKQHLQSQGIEVLDVAEVPDYQKIDIDFLIKKNGKTASLEVKADYRINKTCNFFFEAGAQRGDYVSTGWLFKCKADYVCIYDMVKRHGYILDFPLTCSLLEEHGEVKIFNDNLDNKVSKAYVFRIDLARKYSCIKHEWQD